MPKAQKEFKTKKFETQHIAIVKSQTGFYSTKYNIKADIPLKQKYTLRQQQKDSYNDTEKLKYYQERQNRLVEADELIDRNKTFKDIQQYLDKEHAHIIASKT